MPATREGSGRQEDCAVTLAASTERPWYDPRSAMISLRPVWMHAAVSAVSIASVPELVKNTRRRSPGAISPSLRAASV